MKQVLNSPNKSTMMTDFMNNYSQTNTARVDYYPVSHQDQKLMVIKTASVNDMKCQRSLIVFNAKYALHTTDQANHFVLLVVCYKAFLRRTRSRQSNESTVGSSCRSLDFTIKH